MIPHIFQRYRKRAFLTKSCFNHNHITLKSYAFRSTLRNFNKKIRQAPLVIAVVFILIITFIVTQFLLKSSTSPLDSLISTAYPQRVHIWKPTGSCKGTFTSTKANHSVHNFPYAILREAVVDRRTLSIEQFRTANPSLPSNLPVERLILYFTLHLSVRLTKDNAYAMLLSPNIDTASAVNDSDMTHTQARALVPGIRVYVDHVTHVDPFVYQKSKYHPRHRTTHGRQVSEWQMVVTLIPDIDKNNNSEAEYSSMKQEEFTNLLRKLSMGPSPVFLKFGLTLKRFDGLQLRYNPDMSLACATGWELDPKYPPLAAMRKGPRCAKGAWHVDGSVVISGKALYPHKSRGTDHYKEIAQFAARSLKGPLRFNAVLVAVVTNSSLSDISYRCTPPPRGETTEQCEQRYHDQNDAHLENIQKVVEDELDTLGVDRKLFPNVVIMPFCRLGSSAANSEKDYPCRESHRFAQYHATFYSYAMVAPYYRWAVSYDLDEFFAHPPQKSGGFIPVEDATAVLDRANRFRKGAMYFTWLNFLVNATESRMVTRELLQGKAPHLIALPSRKGKTKDCHKLPPYKTGKSAVRCDVGLGFTIHKPVIQDRTVMNLQLGQKQGMRRSMALRTWHPRIESSFGRCKFDSTVKH